MEEKFLNDIKFAVSDKKVQEDLRIEDNIEYRFALVEEDAFERGKNQGIEQGSVQNTLNIIKGMFKKDMRLKDILDITGKSIDKINQIKNSLNN